MDTPHFLSKRLRSIAFGAAVFAGLYLTRLHGYILFHSLAEIFSVTVACAVFMVAWNARRSRDNGFFLLVGIGYLAAGAVDVLHMLGYKGMGVFPGYDANLPTQLWVAARYLQAATVLVATWFAGRTLNHRAALAGYATVVALLLASIFSRVFPDCFVEGTGLTPFKIYSEYFISALLLTSIPFLWTRRRHFDEDVLQLLVFSIAVAIVSELSFTLYKSDVYGFFNLLGHYLKILSFFLVYRAIIGTELVRSYERLELRVAERTAELSTLAERLQEELSRRRRAEQTLAESERRFRTLVQDLPVGVFIVQDGRIVFQNPEQRRLFGPVPDGFEFREYREVHPEDAGKFEQLCQAVGEEDGRRLGLDLRFFPYGTSSEGADMRWTHVRSTPIEHLGRKAVLVSMADITRARELEQLVRVREKMASLGHVAAGIAHEIRNPLSGINIYVSAMEHLSTRSENLDPEEREKVGAIVEQLKAASNKIASVVKRVMEFSKPGPPQLTRVDLNVAIEEAVQLTSVSLRKKEIALSKALSPDLPRCRADLRLIEQVLLNLINNAAQAMDGLEGPKRIEVGSRAEDGRVLIRVSDSGPGIAPHMREKVFDPFFTTRKEGYGIGLSFSHRVVTDHGGALTVGTSAWGGAEFRIELPLERGEVPA